MLSVFANTVTLAQPLQYEHYGNPSPTISNTRGALDSRTIVGVLTRNIKITSDHTSPLGGTLIVTATLIQPFNLPTQSNTVRIGSASLQNV